MEYIKHYEKNFSDLLNVSNIDHVKQESFNFFSKSGFPIKKKGDERWKYLDLRSLEKTIYSTDYDNDNLSINFDDSDINASYIDPAFPIVKLTNPSYPGEFKFFVVNNEARLQTKKNVYKTEVFELDSTSEDENGTAQIQTGNAKERMYRKAVQVLKQNTSSFYPKFDFTAKRVILPGEKVNFKYKEIIDNEEIFNFNQTELLRDLNYNLLDISQTA